jgi:hypothetical protein
LNFLIYWFRTNWVKWIICTNLCLAMLWESYKKLHRHQLLTLGWAHWSFGFISKLWLLLAIYQGPIFKTLFYKKRCVWQISSICHLGRLCIMFWGWGIQVSVKANIQRIFGGGWAETNTSFCSSSDSLVITKVRDDVEWHFLYNYLSLCYSDISNRVTRAIRNITIT